jgi:DNA polymerase-3 subunit delta'
MAKEQAKKESEIRNEDELIKLKESYGTTGSRLAAGGSKAVKELEKEQKSRASRMTKDAFDQSLLLIQQKYILQLMNDVSRSHETPKIINQIEAIEISRRKVSGNSSNQLSAESLFSQIYLRKI